MLNISFKMNVLYILLYIHLYYILYLYILYISIERLDKDQDIVWIHNKIEDKISSMHDQLLGT